MKISRILLKPANIYIISLGWANSVFAQTLKNPLKAENFGQVVESLARAITAIGIPLAAIFIIYSGFLFVSARGSEEQLKKAKTTFFWTMVGTLLIVGAWAIATAINQFAQGLR
ncbi:MAG: hypothetical protein A2931_01795 [Candidatus Niyogibacteria bacterium RIFCSPLOWO2_01_FULL_45_48]|uniref:Uncharacterized protein n=2 Tax=Candidatus Niyogiibacteriota TaxID=1817912 RepID=A0A1G2EZH4_9BACT|nr:MAG: hypothetical protein A2931_01795 [Candidatus Niyogibacteria bacterium RIFCSPLOWO2_01_FULL_45_48]OGZ31199.1 MAG: hypothetical protein A3J00_01470 [Candidatus Niyogibacteria bacterium RIFCSPLOWO2_02_FULL_45_13]